MSQKFNAKSEVGDILAKSRKNLMERIESFRIQIKDVRQRELNKSLIPVHNHRPGSSVGSGTEDVPPGKVNPKGIDKSMNKLNSAKIPDPTSVAKGEACKNCGGMHKPIEKCGDMTMKPAVKKAELIDEMGRRSTNSEVTKFKQGDKAPEIKAKGSGGVVLPGSKLKKMAKAMTAGNASGAPSTMVKATPALAQRMAVSAGVAKPKPNYTKPATGSTKTTPTLGARMANQALKSEESMEKYVSPSTTHGVSKPVGVNVVSPPKYVSPADHAADKKAAGLSKAGLIPAQKPSVAMSGNLPPGKVPFKNSNGGLGKHILGSHSSVASDTGPKKPAKLPGSHLKITTMSAGPVGAPAIKAEPPMAKPPSGKSMSTHVPTSKAEVSMAKGMFSSAALAADPRSASFAAHTAATAAAKPAAPAKLPGEGTQMGRAASFAAAGAGAFAPKGPINSGLELDIKPKVPALGLGSPKAAGALPKPATAKPGIFGKLLGKR